MHVIPCTVLDSMCAYDRFAVRVARPVLWLGLDPVMLLAGIEGLLSNKSRNVVSDFRGFSNNA